MKILPKYAYRISNHSIIRKACGGKIDHKSQGKASAAARSMARFGEQLEAYPCPHCRGWHTGHIKLSEKA